MKAIWKGQIVAESDETVIIESNHYFPRNSIASEFFSESDSTTQCAWKGTANYLSITVDGETNKNAAWYYATPKEDAKAITGMVAFWRGVQVTT